MNQEQEIIKLLKEWKNTFINEAQTDNIHEYVVISKNFLTKIQEYKNVSPQVDVLINQYFNLVYQTLEWKVAENMHYDEMTEKLLAYMKSYLPTIEDDTSPKL